MSSFQSKYSRYQAKEIKTQMYAKYEVGLSRKNRNDFQTLLCNYLVTINQLPIGPKDIYNTITKRSELKSIKIVKFFLLHKFTEKELMRIIDTKSNDINGFLMACEFGSLDATKTIIAANCVEINLVNINKSNGLHLACENNHIRVVEYILHCNLKGLVNGLDGNGRTPLHCAILAGNIDIINLLINYINHRKSRGKYLKQKDINGNTPFTSAFSLGMTYVFGPLSIPAN